MTVSKDNVIREQPEQLVASSLQQRLWFIEKLVPGSCAYNIAVVLEFSAVEDMARLQRAIAATVRRHSSLRTCFHERNGTLEFETTQWVHVDCPTTDLRTSPSDDAKREVQHSAVRNANEPFDLAIAPLHRLELFRMPGGAVQMSLTIHHLIFDGWSLRLWIGDILAAYASDVDLPPLEADYVDYIRWEKSESAQRLFSAQLQYWVKTLSNVSHVLELPSTKPRPPVQTFHGRTLRLQISSSTAQLARAFAAANSATLFNVLLTAFFVTLGRYTGQRQLTVATPVVNRNSAAFQGPIGYFTNVVSVATELHPDVDFQQLLRAVRGTCAQALGNQDVPFGMVVEAVKPTRDLSRGALCQVLFSLQNAADAEVRLGDASVRYEFPDTGITRYDLELHVFESGSELSLMIVYNADCNDPESIERFSQHYVNVLGSALALPELGWDRLAMLSAAERQRQIEGWNRTKAEVARPWCLHELFERRAAHQPDAVAVCGIEELSYAEIERRATSLAHVLLARGVKVGTRVGVVMSRTTAMIAGVLAITKIGAAYVPIDPGLPDERMRQLLGILELGVIVTQAQHTQRLSVVAPDCEHVVAESAYAEVVQVAELPAVSPDSEAYVIFTSGSTGTPKGVSVMHRRAVNLIQWVNTRFGISSLDKLLFVTSLSFDLSVYDIFGVLAAGGSIRIATEAELQDPWLLYRILVEERITFWDSAPAGLQQLVPAIERGSESATTALRLVFLSGDWVPLGLPDTVRRRFEAAQVVALGGATEATVWSNYHVVERVEPSWRSVPYGRPISNARYYVLDRHRQPVPVGVPGDLWIGGDCLATGYANDPVLTAAKFVDDPFVSEPGAKMYATGDLARHASDGVMEFLGRKDGQVKVRGYRVEIGEIEAVLRRHQAVASAFVLAKSRSGFERYLVAYVVLRSDKSSEQLTQSAAASDDRLTEIKSYLGARLPSYMVPEFVVPIDSVPQTSNGKLDQRALMELPDRVEVAVDRAAAATPIEREMQRIWCAELALPELGVTEDFFAVGGNSMVAVRIVAAMERTLGLAVPIARFFENPTIRALAQNIEQDATTPDDAPDIVSDPAARFEPFALTDMQQAYWIGHGKDFELGLVPHIYLELDLLELDLPRLEKAIEVVIGRQDLLRAVVSPDGEQIVAKQVPAYPLEVVDMTGEPPEVVDEAVSARRRRGIESAPGPSTWPTFWLGVVRSSRGVTLHGNFNLTFCDGGSLVVFFRELQAAYDGRPLPPIVVSARDYVVARLKAREGAKYARARDYWLSRVSKLPAGPELPRRRGALLEGSPRHLVRYQQSLGKEEWSRLKELARQFGITPNIALLSVYASTLARWAKDPEFSLVVMYFNRPDAQRGIGDIVGNFANTIILHVPALGRDQDFASFALNLQAQLAADLEHADFSGVEVIRQLARAQGETGRAVVPVTFASGLDMLPSDPTSREWIRRVSFSSLQVPQVSIDHQMYEDAEGGLRLHWDMSEATFPQGVPAEFVEASTTLLKRMCHAESWGPALSQVRSEPAQRAELLSTWRQTPGPTGLIHDGFLDAAKRFAGQVALEAGKLRFTYAELERLTARWAERIEHETNGASLVGILFHKGWEQVAAALAIVRCGAAYVPLLAEWPKQRIELALNTAGVRWVVTNADLAENLPSGVTPIVKLTAADGFESRTAQASVARRTANDVAYVIFTSGSTGVPKGVVIEHGSVVNTLVDINHRLGIGPEDKVLALSALSFDLSVYDIFGTLATGACLVVPDVAMLTDAQALCTYARDSRISVWNSVPAYMALAQEYLDSEPKSGGLPALRHVLLSGDWIPIDLPARIRARCPRAKVLSLGGATEASIWSIAHEVETVDPAWTSIPYGRALSGQALHVLSHTLERCPDHVSGELYIGGRGLAREYLGDAEKSAAKFIQDPQTGERLYRTGDWGRYWPDGTIEFLGREDAQVKVQGYRVELGEVESCLLQHPAVATACVLATESAAGRRLVGYYASSHACNDDDLRTFLLERLPPYCVPSVLVRVAAIPLTANGKVDRNALSVTAADAGRGGRLELTLDSTTARLQQLWGEVLSVEVDDIDRDFFQLGGNSLTALRLVNRVQRDFSTELTVAALFRAPTIRKFAELVRGSSTEASGVLIPIQVSGAQRKLFCVHPIGGTVLCYRRIASSLAGRADVYGIQSPGLTGEASSAETIEELAQAYCRALTATYPEGPIDLLGWSLGGMIAFEMARVLSQSGRSVARVVLIDSAFSSAKPQDAQSEEWCWQYFLDDLRRLTHAANGDATRQITNLATPAETARTLLGDVSEAQVSRLFAAFKANARAYVGFEPRPIDNDLSLILARESGAKNHVGRWGDLTSGDLQTFEMPGDHHSIFEAESAERLASLVARALYDA